MSDHDDETQAPPTSPRPGGEGVRIIGAEEAARALEEGQAAGRRPDDAPRFGDVPERPSGPTPGYRFPLPDSVDPAVAVPRPTIVAPVVTTESLPSGPAPELPHWTEPPTGEVPRVLAGDDEPDDASAWAGMAQRAPRWRDRGSDWEEPDFEGASALSDDDARLGALDVNRTEHSDLFSFDDAQAREPVYAEPSGAAAFDDVELDEMPPERPQTRAIRTRPPAERSPDGAGGGPGGRDMGAALIVGLGIAVLAIVMFKLGNRTTLLLAVVIIMASAGELFSVLRRAGHQPATLLGLTSTLSLLLAVYDKGVTAVPLVLFLTITFSFLWYLFGVVRARPTVNIAITLLGVCWVGVLGSFASLMLTAPHRRGIAYLLGAVLCTVAYDVGGLFVGNQAGRRPLMPSISPNKTLEGLAGGMAASVVVGGIFGAFNHVWGGTHGLALGVVVALFAPLGDLAESMVKRDLGIKDMGAILPGHGGLLDRFDALLFVLPAVWYLVKLLKIG